MADAQADDYRLARDPGRPRRSARSLTVVVMALIGLILAAATWQTTRSAEAAMQRRQDLIQRVRDQQRAVAETGGQVSTAGNRLASLNRLAAAGPDPELADAVAGLEVAAGYTDVTGPGMVLTLQDAASPLPRGVRPDEARVLDTDMQSAVNGLWQSGARAVAINGVRLTTTTAIRTAGQAILVDYRPLRPPYAIVAVGPGRRMRTDFLMSQGGADLRFLRREYGIRFRTQVEEGLLAPASTSNLPRQAEVVQVPR